ncbi:MAG TPA: TetR/AcrR family transcriptional regulator [Terrimicrobiaceae bacterium]
MRTSLSSGNRDRIVATAERVFLRSGFSRVLMDDLARELGMSKKTLYSHFESKEELLRAVLVRRTGEVDLGLEAIVSAKECFPAKLGHLAGFLQSKVAEVSPVFLEDIRRYAPECFRVVEEFRGRAIPRYFGRLFEEGIRTGHVRKQVNRELLIRMLVLSIQGIIRPEAVEELRLRPREALDHILAILFDGILTPTGRRARRPFPGK